MKCSLPSMILTCLIIHLVLTQISIPLQHAKNYDSSQQNLKTNRHHILRSQNKNPHHSKSIPNHNIDYFRQHLKQSKSTYKTKNHQLLADVYSSQTQKQNFNIYPNASAFLLPIKVAGLQYKMAIDSGSSDIFIKGENAIGEPKERYHCGQTCIKTNESRQISYLDGNITTYQTILQVQLGSYKFNESILIAYEVEGNFYQIQGMIGLSFDESAKVPTFLQKLKSEKIIDMYAFGVNFNFQNKERNFITLGSYDSNFFQGNLSYFPLTRNTQYTIKSEGISIGGNELLSIGYAYFDTGNTAITIPDKYKNDIIKQFNHVIGKGENNCSFYISAQARGFSDLKCKVIDFDALPVVNIHLNRKGYSIPKQFYLSACNCKQSSSAQRICFCNTYIEISSQKPQLLLGGGFFNRYYTFFNLQTKKIGIAPNKQVMQLSKIIQNKSAVAAFLF